MKLIESKVMPYMNASGSKRGCGNLVAKVSDLGWPWHEFEPSTTKDPLCRGEMILKKVLHFLWDEEVKEAAEDFLKNQPRSFNSEVMELLLKLLDISYNADDDFF
ncbi:hypothetical protein TNCV_4150411 [Trichonephila clavipes]|uniref:Uncharacterized protein n=1 Tax=Trichonephila clavipes TaxID=2585209 RepID=A0A8X6W5E8_TRICX|nr:hypothetical protein TNCV_4150411 [Trichonephila clavipes]